MVVNQNMQPGDPGLAAWSRAISTEHNGVMNTLATGRLSEQALNDTIAAGVAAAVPDEVADVLADNPEVLEAAVELAQSDAGLVRTTDERLPQSAPRPGYLFALTDKDGKATDLAIRSTDGQLEDWVLDRLHARLLTRDNLTGRAKFPILSAHLEAGHTNETATALVWTGSSTTARNPGYVVPVMAHIQSLYPAAGGSESTVQFSNSATFTERTAAGVHGYSAAQSGATSATYLTESEWDAIAELAPAAVFTMVGSNDFYEGRTPAQYEDALLTQLDYADSVLPGISQKVFIHQYQRNDVPGTYPWDDYAEVLRRIVRSRTDAAFIDLATPFRAAGVPGDDPLNLLDTDNIHCTTAGHDWLAALVKQALF